MLCFKEVLVFKASEVTTMTDQLKSGKVKMKSDHRDVESFEQ